MMATGEIRSRAWVSGILAILVLAGCGTPQQVRVAEGDAGSGSWELWAARSGDGLCLTVRLNATEAGSICDVAEDSTGTWRVDLGTDQLLVVTTTRDDAQAGALRLVDGTEVPVPPVRAPDVTPLTIFVTPLTDARHATDFVVEGPDGSMPERVPL
jgi:hypothetical protein